MKFEIKIGNEDGSGEPWWEDFDKPYQTQKEVTDFAAWAVNYFNSTLLAGEKPRKFLGEVKIIALGHDWKKTTIVMRTTKNRQNKHGIMYDEYQCARCGITGRRYGVSDVIKRDDKYKAMKYEDCTKPR